MIEDAHRIFEQALAEHDPVAVFLLTSGGNDSIVPLHLFKDHPRVTAAMHIDTSIRVPQVEDHVKAVCEQFGLKLLIYRAAENTKADGTPDPQIFEDIVKQHGFPGPPQHRIMYAKLKERQVRRLVRDYKRKRFDRIMLVTGVRKSESRRRMGTVEEIQRLDAQVWVAPVTHWDETDMRVYREHHNLPVNPISKLLGMSGECLCGAYAKPGELARLEQHFPETAEYIKRIECESGCPWRWEEAPPRRLLDKVGTSKDEFQPLCTSCNARGRGT